MTLAFIIGIVIASQAHLTVLAWTVAAMTGLVLAIPLRRLCFARWNSPPLFLVLAILFAGGLRYQIAQPEITPFHIAWYNDRDYEVLVTGMILEPPDVRDAYANLKIKVQKVDTGNDQLLPAEGLILARVDPDDSYQYGEIIRLRGKLKTPPENEDFSYRDYLARFGIHSYMSFRFLLPVGFNFVALDELQSGKTVGSASALLLAESGYAPVNPPEWIQNLHRQLIILDVAAGDPDGLPHDETLEAVAGYAMLRTPQRLGQGDDRWGRDWVEVERR